MMAADVVRSRALVVAGGTLVVGVGAAGLVVSGVWPHKSNETSPTAIPVSTVAVVRTDVAERRLVNGTLGHEGSFDVVAGKAGTLTRLPATGTVIKRGQSAFDVDGVKVPLFYGYQPAWREMSLGTTDGADMEELESNLDALGYGDGLTVDRHFSSATCRAVRTWQKDMHLPVTGTVPMGQVVFVPAAVRVSGLDLKLGAQLHPGAEVEHGTGSAPDVLVQIAPADVPRVKVGDPVIVSLPDGSKQDGTINNVSSVAVNSTSTSGSASTVVVPVTITLKGTLKGLLDQATVQVGVVTQEHKGVLAVPTVALLARPFGTYVVSVVNGATRRYVEVRLGLFDETSGLTEVSGVGLAAGDRVEVPSGSS
jgi:peptidoglycan hydrolase-like protein with peptidoglycan-binding domain